MTVNMDKAPAPAPVRPGGESGRVADAGVVCGPAGDTSGIEVLVGLAAVLFSALYLISDLMELGQGGFSTPQLFVTYAAEAAIPLFVLGLYAVQRPRIGRLGLAAALVYAYTFVYFTSTVVYALIERISDWQASAGVRDLGFAAMGAVLLARARSGYRIGRRP